MIEGDDEPLSVQEEATDWLMRTRAAPTDGALARDLEAWLARSADHRVAFARASRAWRVLGAAAPVSREAPRRVEDWAPSSRSRRPFGWTVALLGLAACLAAVVVAPVLVLRFEADHATGTGEILTVRLTDGTTVLLGAASAISEDVSAADRRVTLLAGEAFFDVAPDQARPFHVDADGTTIAAVGTRFDVRLSRQATRVALEEGAVTVEAVGEEGSVTAILRPGDAVSVDRPTGLVTPGRVAIEDIGAWRQGRLFVESEMIADVVEDIRRYHPAFIVIADAALGRERVTGLYDLGDPDRALAALVDPHGGRVQRFSSRLRILSRD